MDFYKYKEEVVIDAKLDLEQEIKKRGSARNTTIDDKVKNRIKLRSGEQYVMSFNTGEDIVSITSKKIVINYNFKLPYVVSLEEPIEFNYSKRNRMYVLEILAENAGFDVVCRDKRTLVRLEDFISKYID